MQGKQLETQEFADGIVIRHPGRRIDAAGAIEFKDRMKAITDLVTGRIVLDLGQVDFIDSSGLGAIVGAMKQLGPGRKLELAALTPTVEKVFQLTRMDTVFPIHPTATDAGLTPAPGP